MQAACVLDRPESAAHAAEPAVRVAGLCKAYRGQLVLSDVTLDIAPGETFCLVGRNGAGKSTILEILKGIRKATSGEVRVLGRHPMDESLKTECAMLMDRHVFPYYAKVREIVALHAGFYARPLDPLALLSTFELNPEKHIRHLSRGQMQRLGTVLALLGRPALVLLDEPTAALDPQGQEILWDGLRRPVGGASCRTVVFVTHDMSEAERWADRIGVLHQGRLLTTGTAAALYETFIGTRRKLTVVGPLSPRAELHHLPGVRSTATVGSETVFYTDEPHDVLRRIGGSDGYTQVRIEDVSLRDVYFRLTGESPHASPTVAH